MAIGLVGRIVCCRCIGAVVVVVVVAVVRIRYNLFRHRFVNVSLISIIGGPVEKHVDFIVLTWNFGRASTGLGRISFPSSVRYLRCIEVLLRYLPLG